MNKVCKKTHIPASIYIFLDGKGMCSSRKYPYSPHRRFLVYTPPPPPKKFYLASYFASQILVFKTSSPKEFLMTFHEVGMDFFWNCTICLPTKHLTSQELVHNASVRS